MSQPSINILLASYNGEKFIADQLDSIINQSYKDWQLYIRDDGSKDATVDIIKNYTSKDARIHLAEDNLGNIGSCQNFSALINKVKHSDGYIMFSDQDDVWLTEKIENTLQEMLLLEKQYGSNMPLLVHTNFLYVDEALQPIESKKNFEATKIKEPVLSNVLCQTSVYGCTMMINAKLADITGNIPPVAENHDYWLSLVASAFGKVHYTTRRTILYRQHTHNASTKFNYNSFSERFKRIFINKTNFNDVGLKIKMAVVFKHMYYTRLSTNNKKMLDDFISMYTSKSLSLLYKNLKHGVRRQTMFQTVLFYLTLLLSKSSPAINAAALFIITFTAL